MEHFALINVRDVLIHIAKTYDDRLRIAHRATWPDTLKCDNCKAAMELARVVANSSPSYWCNDHLYKMICTAIDEGSFSSDDPLLEAIMPRVDTQYLEDYISGIV